MVMTFSIEEISDRLETQDLSLKMSQHQVATSAIILAGDTATARSICHVAIDPPGEASQVFFSGLLYLDTFARTPEGWRISDAGSRSPGTTAPPIDGTNLDRAWRQAR
jgi:hypothetical protein